MEQVYVQGVLAFFRFLQSRGMYTLAETHLQEAHQISKRLNYTVGIAKTFQYLGQIKDKRGDYQSAEALYLDGLNLARQINDTEVVVSILINIGGLAGKQGNWVDAETHLQEGLSLATQIQNRGNMSALLANLGGVAANRGDYDQAEKFFLQGLELSRQSEDKERTSILLTNMGEVAQRRGNLVKAEYFYQQALPLVQELGHLSLVSVLLQKLGNIAETHKQYSQAKSFYQEGLQLVIESSNNERISFLLAALGSVIAKEGHQDEQARAYLQQGLRIARQIGSQWHVCIALNEWGEFCLNRQRLEEAQNAFQETLDLAQKLGFQEFVALALYGLARVVWANGNRGAAHQQARESLKIFTALGHGKLLEVKEWLNQLTEKQLTLNVARNPLVIVAVLFIVMLTGFGAGLYPAVFLSSFAPLSVLKSFRSSSKGAFLRKSLVTFQFAISIGLIAGIVLVHNQIQFMREAELGFSKDQVVVIPIRETSSLPLFRTLQQELEKIPDVVKTSIASKVPGKEMGNNVVRLGWDDQAAWSDMRFLSVDYDYQKLYDLELIEGRWFDRQFPADEEESFVINESAVARLGFASPAAAMGQPLQWQRKKGRVIGVLKDFHFMSLQNTIEPFIAVMSNGHNAENISIKVSTPNYHTMIDRIKAVYETVLPGRIFEYQFLDEDFDQLYRAEDRFNSILLVFTGLAIFVACLGLLGLISYTAQQRTKEIGIRKVMGATVANIVFLICRDFMKLVVLAMIVATPLAYYLINLWLQDFPYRTGVALWVFPFAGLVAVALAFFTISFQAVKAAVANPVQSLKYE
ncbi:tetratricopeptide repeat protein [bacterium]|nr:tetratricopeptide repeat protein [bacterium]